MILKKSIFLFATSCRMIQFFAKFEAHFLSARINSLTSITSFWNTLITSWYSKFDRKFFQFDIHFFFSLTKVVFNVWYWFYICFIIFACVSWYRDIRMIWRVDNFISLNEIYCCVENLITLFIILILWIILFLYFSFIW
jgi:hypothetical protein